MIKPIQRLLLGAALAILAGCATSGAASLKWASNQQYCPAGTVLICTGLYEPERELAPSCGCADLVGRR